MIIHVAITQDMGFPADDVFAALVDWASHADWVPLTRVRIEHGDGGPGTVFVATTGVGVLALPDRMRVEELDNARRSVRITKIGPVLEGNVEIAVEPSGPAASTVNWIEDITVSRMRWLPGPICRVLGLATGRGFVSSLHRLERRLAATSAARPDSTTAADPPPPADDARDPA